MGWIFLIYLTVYWDSWMCKLMYFISFGNSVASISLNILSVPFLSFDSGTSHFYICRNAWCCCTGLIQALPFLFSFCLFLKLCNISWSFLTFFFILSSVSWICYWNPLVNFSCQLFLFVPFCNIYLFISLKTEIFMMCIFTDMIFLLVRHYSLVLQTWFSF